MRFPRLSSRTSVPTRPPATVAATVPAVAGLLAAAVLAAGQVPSAHAAAGFPDHSASWSGVAGSAPTPPTGSSAGPGAGSSTGPVVDPTDNLPDTFDLQSHRGGRGEYTEESRVAFEKSLDLGVTTLEFDIHITGDGVPVVWHDASIQDDKCTDTAPVTPDDPLFPYVGKDVHDLTWEQIQTLTCDRTLSGFPDAVPVTGNRILQLKDVFDIASRDPEVHFNIETKVEADDPSRSASPREYVDAILDTADAAGVTDRIAVQSFDWSTLPLVRDREPGVPLVALWDVTTWRPGSPFLGPVDFLAVGGDPVRAGEELGVQVLSPSYNTANPWFTGDVVGFIDRAHGRGMRVVPWTVNEAADMEEYIDAGADGIITDYPTRLKNILDTRGISYR